MHFSPDTARILFVYSQSTVAKTWWFSYCVFCIMLSPVYFGHIFSCYPFSVISSCESTFLAENLPVGKLHVYKLKWAQQNRFPIRNKISFFTLSLFMLCLSLALHAKYRDEKVTKRSKLHVFPHISGQIQEVFVYIYTKKNLFLCENTTLNWKWQQEHRSKTWGSGCRVTYTAHWGH